MLSQLVEEMTNKHTDFDIDKKCQTNIYFPLFNFNEIVKKINFH